MPATCDLHDDNDSNVEQTNMIVYVFFIRMDSPYSNLPNYAVAFVKEVK